MSQQGQVTDATEDDSHESFGRESATTTKLLPLNEPPKVHTRKRLHNSQAGKFTFFQQHYLKH